MFFARFYMCLAQWRASGQKADGILMVAWTLSILQSIFHGYGSWSEADRAKRWPIIDGGYSPSILSDWWIISHQYTLERGWVKKKLLEGMNPHDQHIGLENRFKNIEWSFITRVDHTCFSENRTNIYERSVDQHISHNKMPFWSDIPCSDTPISLIHHRNHY